ncbi:DUF4280 domain-containing protein [Sphingobacterium sp. SRCM116780]|uniref:PAAR-like protein n=1 Tax=Sphingobacterium sp. SRCM116780 TaxID=2907623 RepID=UPI001F16D6F6|nr:PAAR-like protein [Sphingobacterium sp. SRCM116780]UIR57812.1 DUF4280 domain-containing protein [Sphingobacterium sp. SRCM116780]
MSDENKKYVPEGVFLVCDMGATPSQLIATPRKVNLYGPMLATDADNKFTINILPFGACKKLGAPCTFACVEWTKTKSGSVFANNQKPLLEDSEAICAVGQGKIKIFFDKYEADLANENNNESDFVSEEISSNILGQALTFPYGAIVDLFCDDDKKFTEGAGRGFKKGMEGTFNFFTHDIWQGETWVGLGKMAVIGVAYSGPLGPVMGDSNLQAIDQAFGTDFRKTKDALVEGVNNVASNAWEDVKRGETGEVGESIGQIQYAIVEAVAGSKGAGLVVKGLSAGAKALIGAERLVALSAKISKFANALKQGILAIVKVGSKTKTIILPLKGGMIELKNILEELFTYTKRSADEADALRKAFNNTEKKKFFQELLKDENRLKAKGLTDTDIQRMKDGLNPKGYDVHHKYPLDDSGTNALDNLVLIKNDPYHKALTVYQNTVTKGMEAGAVKEFPWYTMPGNIYP